MSAFLNAENAFKWSMDGGGALAKTGKMYLWSKNIVRNSTNQSDIETAVLQLLEYDHLLETFLDQFNRWKPVRVRTIREIIQIADETDGLRWGCNVANIAGSTLSTLGGALTVAGILAAPVTLGGSLSLSVAGTGITLGGAATNITTSVVECRKMKVKCDTLQRAVDRDKQLTAIVVDSLQNLVTLLGTLDSLSERLSNIKILEDLMSGFKVASIGGKAVSAAGNIDKSLGALKCVKTLSKSQISAFKSCPKMLKNVKVFKDTVLTASKLTTGVAIIGIGASIWDIVSNSIELHNGSRTDAGKNLREYAAALNLQLVDVTSIVSMISSS